MSDENLEEREDQNQTDDTVVVSEDSMAAATLKPNSRPATDPKSKVEYMQSVLGAMHSMKREDLSKWFNQAMDLIGKEADSLPAGASADKNSSSVDSKLGKGPKTKDAMPKIASITPGQSMKEDIDEMFSGDDLSEEFKDKASTLFEAAISLKLTTEIARLEEQFETQLAEQVSQQVSEMERKLDSYLDYVVENWMEENQVAIESTLRSEITEEFIGGLKNLFVEHYIDIPSDKTDVVESMAEKIQQLEAALDETINENVELKRDSVENQRKDIVSEMVEGMTLSQTDKFVALAEGISFDGDLDTYRGKLVTVKNTYFNSTKPVTTSNIEEEVFEGGETVETKYVDPVVNKYVQAISRTIKH
jgi:hypothetical protein